MRFLGRPLFLLHPDPFFRARVRQAAVRRFEVEEVASWEALQDALETASLAALAVVDPYTAIGRHPGLAPELRSLLRAFPSATVVAAVVAGGRMSDLRTLGAWGVAELVSVETDDALQIRDVLDSVRGRPLQSVLERAVPATATGRVRELLSAAAETASAGGEAEDLACNLHLSLRTLNRRYRGAGLPPPRTTLAWMRVLLAAELLEQPERSLERVAAACGYASESGLRRLCYDFLEMSPKELREAGAFATAARAFRRSLATVPAAPSHGESVPAIGLGA